MGAQKLVDNSNGKIVANLHSRVSKNVCALCFSRKKCKKRIHLLHSVFSFLVLVFLLSFFVCGKKVDTNKIYSYSLTLFCCGYLLLVVHPSILVVHNEWRTKFIQGHPCSIDNDTILEYDNGIWLYWGQYLCNDGQTINKNSMRSMKHVILLVDTGLPPNSVEKTKSQDILSSHWVNQIEEYKSL